MSSVQILLVFGFVGAVIRIGPVLWAILKERSEARREDLLGDNSKTPEDDEIRWL